MIEKIRVTRDQNIVDVVIQEYGSIEGLVPFAKLNGIKVDGELDPDIEYKIETNDVLVPTTRQFFKNNDFLVATGLVSSGIFDETFDDTFE